MRRGGPAEFDIRLARCEHVHASDPTARQQLTLLALVLEHQRQRSATPQVSTAVERIVVDEPTQRSRGQYPLLDPSPSIDALAAELELAVDALDNEQLPAALRTGADEVRRKSADDRAALLEAWLDAADLAPAIGFWCGVASGPVFELAAAAVLPPPEDWAGRRCPICAGPPHISVIAEETGEILGGPPRHLVCARCAAWWSFPRATCPVCGEQDPRLVSEFVAPDNRAVRIDGCEACHTYVKSFDLRPRAARDVVPLVDDLATVSLDHWVEAQGFRRVSPCPVGM